ncbi:MAG: DnaJ domain-containing protein [Actinobacteria bacterium]|nr:DnaJ domain-containing protein [Actinomycetota bacterium]
MRRYSTLNYYAILGVASTASKDEIKAAYRVLARKTHPDAGGKPERFAQIAEAWEVLSDDEERELYDADRSLQARAARPYTAKVREPAAGPSKGEPGDAAWAADGMSDTQRWIKNKRRF